MGPAPRDAAVLVPIYRDAAGAWRLILIRRAPGGLHGGQLAFPGGRPEEGDGDLYGTALREAEEEIGLSPARVRRVAALATVHTLGSNHLIHPFLGCVRPPAAWRPQADEVAQVLEPELRELSRPDRLRFRERRMPHWSAPRRLPFLEVGPYELWGASLRILEPLLPRFEGPARGGGRSARDGGRVSDDVLEGGP